MFLKKTDQQIVLVFEVKVDRPTRHTGRICNLADPSIVETPLGEYFYCSVDDPTSLVVFMTLGGGGDLKLLNECSFSKTSRA